ncbi:MAG: hypothetical protein IT328_07910 [Caldilineaceae bacterium]|nr:hypothetical protein [Caldilineaceae bacterium]
MTTGCYLIHFIPAYRHAVHYLGWSPEVQARINAHICGKGARLTEVAYAAGIEMIWVRTWPDADRKVERKLKNRHGSGKFCPICKGKAVQMPLMPWMPAYMPQDEQEQPERDNCDYQPKYGPSLFD